MANSSPACSRETKKWQGNVWAEESYGIIPLPHDFSARKTAPHHSMPRSLLILVIAAALTSPLSAMLKHIERVTPRIAQLGTTVDVSIQGAHLGDPKEIIFDRPGIRVLSIEPMAKLSRTSGLMHGGRIEQEVRCRFEIAPDCPPGEHRFRLRTATQLTSLGTFHVTPFPLVDEEEAKTNSNDTIATAVSVPSNVTVRGRVGNSAKGDVDVFRVPARAGERLSVEVDCVRLADVHYGDSEFDTALRVLDATGHEIAANDENPLHLQDPLLSLKLPADTQDHVFVEIRRSVFVAGDVPYALHIGTFARPLAIYPGGGSPGETLAVKLLGDGLGQSAASLAVPASPGFFNYFGEAPSALRLRSFAGPNVLEEPAAAETPVPNLPAALNGLLDVPGDKDSFRVKVKKGDRLRVRVHASSLGSPLDVALSIRKADEAKPEITADDADLMLADRDIFGPNFRSRGGLNDVFDPSVIWEPKADGDYLLEVRDTNGFGTNTGVYRIEIDTPPDSVFALLRSAAFDWAETGRFTALAVPQGNHWTFNLSLPTGQGTLFKGDMQIVAKGLPPGVTLLNGKVPGGTSTWPVQLTAGPEAKPGGAVITLEVQSADPAKKIETASMQWVPFINHSGGDAWRAVKSDHLIMAVTDAAPFSIALQPPAIPLVRGGELAIPVTLTRRAGFSEPVEFKCDFAPAGVVLPPAETIPGDRSEAILRISAATAAQLGTGPISVIATTLRETNAYLGTGEIRVSAPVISITLSEPFLALTSEPASVRRSSSAAYRWTVTPKSPFEGEATVNLLGLPKGVNVREPLPRITSASKEVTFQIQATEEALLGSITGLECEITVHAAGQEIRQRTGKGNLRIDPKL